MRRDHGRDGLDTLFVDPDFQNRGVGARAWRFIESVFPDARSWELSTPARAAKNRYFYESKCGFQRVAEIDTDAHEGAALLYRKRASD